MKVQSGCMSDGVVVEQEMCVYIYNEQENFVRTCISVNNLFVYNMSVNQLCMVILILTIIATTYTL